jgi:hypothetical protein
MGFGVADLSDQDVLDLSVLAPALVHDLTTSHHVVKDAFCFHLKGCASITWSGQESERAFGEVLNHLGDCCANDLPVPARYASSLLDLVAAVQGEAVAGSAEATRLTGHAQYLCTAEPAYAPLLPQLERVQALLEERLRKWVAGEGFAALVRAYARQALVDQHLGGRRHHDVDAELGAAASAPGFVLVTRTSRDIDIMRPLEDEAMRAVVLARGNSDVALLPAGARAYFAEDEFRPDPGFEILEVPDITAEEFETLELLAREAPHGTDLEDLLESARVLATQD